jgi:hypothetical protein
MTNHVIECVHRIANREKMPDGLKIMSKTGEILHDNAWLPGVHYSTINEDKEEEREGEFHVNNLEDDEDETDENDIYEIVNVLNVKEKDNLSQDDKNDNEDDNESNSTYQVSKTSNIGRNEDTDPENEQQEETIDNRRTVIRSG